MEHVVQELHNVLERVSEDAAHVAKDINAGPTQLCGAGKKTGVRDRGVRRVDKGTVAHEWTQCLDQMKLAPWDGAHVCRCAIGPPNPTHIRASALPSKGMSSNLAMRPVPSFTGRAPTRCSTMATLSPLVLMASRPHRFTATVSGKAESFCSLQHGLQQVECGGHKPF